MQFKNILVPYDDSDHAKNALSCALGMVGDNPAAKIHVVMILSMDVVPTSALSSGGPYVGQYASMGMDNYDRFVDSMCENARADFAAEARALVDGADCQVCIKAVADSSPVDGILHYVEDNNCDLVVMGRRGLGALRGMLGSVSFGVLRSVDVPVLTVK